MFRLLFALALGVAVTLSFVVRAGGDAMTQATASSATTSVYSEGEIREIDVDQGRVTLKHGPIENLGMPAMTMVFRVTESAGLGNLRAGDTVKFKADRLDGLFVLTALERR